MDDNHKKALIIAFYLSKFDRMAYKHLKFGNMTDTHKKIGIILNVNPNTIKNMRDEFDSVLDNGRKGWWQKPLSKTRLQTIEKFDNLSESSLNAIVVDILNKSNTQNEEVIKDVLITIDDNNEYLKAKRCYSFSTSRGKTGLAAENYFISNYVDILQNIGLKSCSYIDTRSCGCGYDFEIIADECKKYLEVKGLSGEQGSILFTDKEWNTALKFKEQYILLVVKNVNIKPEIKFIINPAEKYKPFPYIQQVVQINWILKDL